MSMIREGGRQVMAWLHGWTGLLLGHLLLVMCFAGTLSLFKPEIGRWMRPETTATADPAEALAATADWLAHNTVKSTGWYLAAPGERGNTVEGSYDSEGTYRFRAFDPVSGAPVPRETLGGEFFYRLHFELELPYPWGRLLASLAAIVMLTAILTGIIAHRRFFKDIFTFRPARGQRSWLDAHNALGVLALPFHIMITLTGLVTLGSLNMPWGIAGAYGEDVAAMYRDLAPGQPERAATGEAAPLVPLGPLLQDAQRRLGGPIGRLWVLNPGDRGALVTIIRADADRISYSPPQASYDGATGRLLGTLNEERPVLQAYNVLYGLHLAHFAPLLTRWLYFLGGAMLTLAIASGLILWIVKRRERAPLSWGNRVMERLNVGMIAGVPIGAVAYLAANRLLPLELAGRPEAEAYAALWTAAAAILAGLALPPRWGWPALLAMLAAGCAVVPLLGPLRGDGVLLTGNLMLWVIALALAPIVGRLVKRPHAQTRPTRRARRQAA